MHLAIGQFFGTHVKEGPAFLHNGRTFLVQNVEDMASLGYPGGKIQDGLPVLAAIRLSDNHPSAPEDNLHLPCWLISLNHLEWLAERQPVPTNARILREFLARDAKGRSRIYVYELSEELDTPKRRSGLEQEVDGAVPLRPINDDELKLWYATVIDRDDSEYYILAVSSDHAEVMLRDIYGNPAEPPLANIRSVPDNVVRLSRHLAPRKPEPKKEKKPCPTSP